MKWVQRRPVHHIKPTNVASDSSLFDTKQIQIQIQIQIKIQIQIQGGCIWCGCDAAELIRCTTTKARTFCKQEYFANKTDLEHLDVKSCCQKIWVKTFVSKHLSDKHFSYKIWKGCSWFDFDGNALKKACREHLHITFYAKTKTKTFEWQTFEWQTFINVETLECQNVWEAAILVANC